MPSRDDQINLAIATIPSISSKLGIFVSRDGLQATVNVSGTTVTLPFVGMYLPPPGHPVQLELRNGQLVVSGPARPLPGVGKIVATGSPRVTVQAWGADGAATTYVLPYRSTYTPALNDEVEITWSADTGVVQGRLSTTLATAPAPETVPPAPPQLFHPGPFTAVDSGTWSQGKWAINDVYASASTTGMWWYGSKIADTIPDDAVIRSAAIYLPARQLSGDAPNLGYHGSAPKPAAPTGFAATYPLTGERSGWVPFPPGWVDYLKANIGGLGFDHGGYNIYRGLASDQLSGALDISWEA